MKLVAGHLTLKNGRYYAVLNYRNAGGQRKTKWIALGLPEKGNKRKAEAELPKFLFRVVDFMECRTEWVRRAGGDETKPAGAAEIQTGGAAEILPLRLHRGADAPGHHQGVGIAEAAERTEPGCPLIRIDAAVIKQIAE